VTYGYPPACASDAGVYSGMPTGNIMKPTALLVFLRLPLMALFCLLLCLTGAAAYAGTPVPERWTSLTHTAFKHHLEPELGGGTVFAQDHSGFLWIGTQSGLVRWDGYRSRLYTSDPDRPGSLPDNFVLDLHVDRRGVLWVGTSAGGLARYDADTDRFHTYPSGPEGMGERRAAALADDGAGGLWIGTGTGLVRLDAQGRFSRPAAERFPPGDIEALVSDRGGRLWIGTTGGLLLADGGASAHPFALGGGKPPSIETLYQDSAGRIWIGTRSNGAFVVEPGATAAQAVRESGAVSTIGHERVMSVTEAGNGEVWLATEGAGGGIVAVNPTHGSTRRIRHQPDVTDSLHDNDIYALFRDRSGMVFAAGMLAMSQHDPQPHAVTTLRNTGTASAERMSVPSVLVHPNGRVWMAVSGGGIDIVDPVSGLVAKVNPGNQSGGALPNGRVLSLAAAPDGSVYIGTRLGLYRSDADGKQVRRLNIPGRAPNLPVYALRFAGDVLWLGGLDGLWGLASAQADTLRLVRRESTRLGDIGVKAIFPAPDGDIWIGTRTGIARVDMRGGQVELLPTDATDPTRVGPGYLSSIIMDKRGRLWFSSFGVGVLVLERTDSSGRRWFRRLGKAQGLRDTSVNALLEDAAGVIWASTDAGLARIDPDGFAVRLLGAAEGVHVNTYWTNSAVKSAHGELLFGGLSGLTVLRPAEMAAWDYRAPLAVTRLIVNDKEAPAARLNQAAPPAVEITPDGSERGFSLEFAALDYSAPERNQYNYRLDGFDPGWRHVDAASRRISYNNLKPGNYTLELRGSNRDGLWSPTLTLPVRVLPAWHQRDWVRLLAVAALLALVAGLVQARTAILRRRQRELEAMVQVRTAELEATQAQLQHLAYADPLTGLPNRRMFNDEMRHLSAQALRGVEGFTLVLIDLDHFKQINDTLGHDAGDALLVATAGRLAASVRGVDRLFRLGGDEFAVLLSQTSEVALIDAICERIVHSMREPVPYFEKAMCVSASVGAAPFTARTASLEELYKTADAALYRSKARGRDTWTLHGSDERETLPA